MLAGPGAISTAIVLQNQAAGWLQVVALYLCIIGVALVSYIILRLSVHGARWLSRIAMNITVRIMGLLLTAVAIQFALNAAKQLRADWLQSPP